MAEQRNAKSLIRTRGSIKARLMSFKKYLDKLIQPGKATAAIDEIETEHIIETEQRLQKVEELFYEFEKCQTEIELMAEGEENFEEQVKQRATFEENYFSIISGAKKFIADACPTKAEPSVHADLESIHSIRMQHPNRELYQNISVKLPQIKLPCFDGSYGNWSVFYDTFQSLIHTSDKISDIEKFHYLRGALKDDAVKVIQHLEVSAVNYQSAWLLLEKRYKNKSLMIHNHIKGIVGYPKITKESTAVIRQLSDTIQGHLRALRSLEEPVDHWDSLLIFVISKKFDTNTEKEWELELLKSAESPTQTTLLDFLEKRCHFLEKIEKKVDIIDSSQNSKQRQGTKPQSKLSHANTQRSACPLCKEQHALFSCKLFLDLSVQDRIDRVRQLKLCFNCLRTGHISTNCKGSHCRKCDKSHNTLLHINTPVQSNAISNKDVASQGLGTQDQPTSTNSIVNHALSNDNTHKVLATGVVYIANSIGKTHNCIALLDGSQSNFMTTSLCRRLKLATSRVNIPIIGINQSKTKTVESTITTIKSKHSSYEATISFLLLPKITDELPSESIKPNLLDVPKDIALADPKFYQSKRIDILLGVDIFWDLICNEHVKHPHLYKTQLGYVVAGQIPQDRLVKESTLCNLSLSEISNQLARFWELEECPQIKELSGEEQTCESHFIRTIKRDDNGRFVVSMPLKGTLDLLGNSREQAKKAIPVIGKKVTSKEIFSG